MGCARTVTNKDLTGNQLRMEITLAGNVSAQARYYIIFSAGAEPQFPDVTLQPYLMVPGETYEPENIVIGDSNRDISYYYENYFSTWGDVLTLENGSFYLTSGVFPVTANETVHYTFTREALDTNQASSSNQIVLTVDLNRLNNGLAIDNLYFNVLAVDANKLFVDQLDGSERVRNIMGEVQGGADPDDSIFSDVLDIRKWAVAIE